MARRPTIKPITGIDDPRYIKALSHPLRLRILALLEEMQASPVQLADHLDATLGTVAYHVRMLERLGLVELVATHQRRGATEHVFAARPHPRVSDSAWANADPMARNVFISSLLSQIGQYVTQSAAHGGFDRPDAHGTRNALKLDEKGWASLATAIKKWLAEVERIESQSKKRIEKSGEVPFDVGLVIMLFEAMPFSRITVPSDAKRASRRAKPAVSTA